MMVSGEMPGPVIRGGEETVGSSVDDIAGTRRSVVIHTISSVLSQVIHNLTL